MSNVTRLFGIPTSCKQLSSDQVIEDFQKFLSDNPEYDQVLLVAVKSTKITFEYNWMKSKMLNTDGIVVLKLVIDDFIDCLKG